LPDADKKEIERILEDGMGALDDALGGMDESKAALRPHPESWSVLDCVLHISLTESVLLGRLKDAKPGDSSREDRVREARFQELALNRSRRIEAPERVVPRTGSQTLAEAYGAFKAVRSETMRFVEQFDGDLRWWLTSHPLITRPVNCYEMLLLMALHPKRHAQQIAEIREQLSDPRSQIE
jgi:hypothetical protein